MRRLLIVLSACYGGAAAPDAAVVGDAPDAAVAVVDGATCEPPATPDAGPVTAATCTAGGIPGSCLDTSICIASRHPTAGLCAGGANIECCTPRFADGVRCDPNQAPDPNACLSEAAGEGGCPAGMVKVDSFCIDKYEAAIAGASPFHPPPAGAKAVSLAGGVPQAYISQIQASAACVAAGKRLCTDTEWLRACQGPAKATYPYGNTRMPGVCNDGRATHPAVELYGTSDSWIFSHLDSPCLNQEANGLAEAGAHAGCVTAEGVFDMMGNVHEWTADPNGTFRGGYYVDTTLNGNGCLYATTAHDTSYSDYSTGFRCCHD